MDRKNGGDGKTSSSKSCSFCAGKGCPRCTHADFASEEAIMLPRSISRGPSSASINIPEKSYTLNPFASPLDRSMVEVGDKVSVPNVIVMVGLPARGKTYIAKKLTRYLNWIGIKAKTFNVGEYRRQAVHGYQNHDFFRMDNEEAMKIREQVAKDALDDAFRWFENDDGEVALYDATNTTRLRRNMIRSRCIEKGYNVFYVESVCNDESIVSNNINDVKLNGPDYKQFGRQSEQALKDFLLRIKHYEETYEPLDETLDSDLSFIRICDAGKKYLVNRPGGHIQSRVIYFLMNIHITPRAIYITRHGESKHNLKQLLGGDSELSDSGVEYAKRLADFIQAEGIRGLHVWTSQMQRTIQTAQYIDAPKEKWKCLNEINAGICEEMTYAEIQELYPVEFAKRDQDKYRYRYPGGESYEDVVARLEPAIIELERQNNILVIGHQAVLRCLLGYFLNQPPEELPYQDIPLHTVLKLVPKAYGCEITKTKLLEGAVDTFRPQPKNVDPNRSKEDALLGTPLAVPQQVFFAAGDTDQPILQ